MEEAGLRRKSMTGAHRSDLENRFNLKLEELQQQMRQQLEHTAFGDHESHFSPGSATRSASPARRGPRVRSTSPTRRDASPKRRAASPKKAGKAPEYAPLPRDTRKNSLPPPDAATRDALYAETSVSPTRQRPVWRGGPARPKSTTRAPATPRYSPRSPRPQASPRAASSGRRTPRRRTRSILD